MTYCRTSDPVERRQLEPARYFVMDRDLGDADVS